MNLKITVDYHNTKEHYTEIYQSLDMNNENYKNQSRTKTLTPIQWR